MSGYRTAESFGRNIHLLDADNNEIGGAYQHGSLTWEDLCQWMEITYLLPIDSYVPYPCTERGNPNNPVEKHGQMINIIDNKDMVDPGYYILLSPQGLSISIPINPENPIPRVRSTSGSQSPRRVHFITRVRQRDNGCVLTREPPIRNSFTTLDVTHIFPLALLDNWKSDSLQRLITDDAYEGETGIHSIQNGILLDTSLHVLFDKYLIAINPDNGYKVHCFTNSDRDEIDGTSMYRNPKYLEKHQPSAELLREHFRLSVLYNMKEGAGFPEWDEDIPEGYDQIAEISQSEQGKFRLEMVIAERLNSLIA